MPRTTSDTDPGLSIGLAQRVKGRYIAHWEWTRFEIQRPRRWFGHRRELCALVPAEGVAADPLEVLGIERPEDWRRHRGLSFHVVADVVPIEQGNFGHRGSLQWRLEVLCWVDVRLIE